MHPANLLSILDCLAQELNKTSRIDFVVNNVKSHFMFPTNVLITYERKTLSIAQDDTLVANFRCDGKTNLLMQITEVKQALGLSPREFMLHRMRNEG